MYIYIHTVSGDSSLDLRYLFCVFFDEPFMQQSFLRAMDRYLQERLTVQSPSV